MRNSRDEVIEMVRDMQSIEKNQILNKYGFNETKDWKVEEQRKNFSELDGSSVLEVDYRPFDEFFSYFPLNKINKIIPRGDSRHNLMKHFILGKNLGLLTTRKINTSDFKTVFISENLTDIHTISDQTYTFPLYLYPDDSNPQHRGADPLEGVTKNEQKPRPNFNPEIIKQIETELGMELDWSAWINESFIDSEGLKFSAKDLLDYIYAVLHSPSYRERYKEFLKIDFPRVNFKLEKERFWRLVKLGNELRKLHLMEGINPLELEQGELAGEGENTVEKIKYQNGRAWINDTKYFDNVPDKAWNFYIGGYQPARKWLKDRKGRQLSFDDILHYQKIIYVLGQTDRMMSEIDK